MLGTLGWQELLIILVILALLFGATRVRDLGGALGSGIREFRTQARGDDEDDEDGDDADAAAATSSDGEKSSDSSG
jgi:sec-independent protein translocase protein TatA